MEFNYNGNPYETIYSVTATSSSHAMMAEVDEMGDIDRHAGFAEREFFRRAIRWELFLRLCRRKHRQMRSMNFGGIFPADGWSALAPGTLDMNAAGLIAPGRLPPRSHRLTATDAERLLPSLATPVSFAYYIAGPEVIRLVEIDATTGVTAGSAYGQGSNSSVNNAQVAGNYVFAMHGYGVNGANGRRGSSPPTAPETSPAYSIAITPAPSL